MVRKHGRCPQSRDEGFHGRGGRSAGGGSSGDEAGEETVLFTGKIVGDKLIQTTAMAASAAQEKVVEDFVCSLAGSAAVAGSRALAAPAYAAAPNIEMVFVKGGCYQMGNTFDEGTIGERPVHEVCIDDFYIGKYEVTQAQYQAVMGSNPSFFKECGGSCPVTEVSWDDAQAFIGKLSQMSGKAYRLPTEAEWEYAARSGGKKEKWAGTSDKSRLGDYAWIWDNSGQKAHVVGVKLPNGLGIHDMSGNVWEWVQDRLGWYQESPRDNPQGPMTGTERVFRGGNYYYGAGDARASARRHDAPGERSRYLGFRLALPAVR